MSAAGVLVLDKRAGVTSFDAVAEGFPRYRSGSVRGSAIEVFPHATAVVLSGFLPPKGMTPHAWRRGVLRSNGVDAGAMRSASSRWSTCRPMRTAARP